MKKQTLIIRTNCANTKQIKQLEDLGLKVIIQLTNNNTIIYK